MGISTHWIFIGIEKYFKPNNNIRDKIILVTHIKNP